MMIQDALTEFEARASIYGTFKQRSLAILVDTVVLLPLAVVDRFNKTEWKSGLLLTLVFLIELSYKPLLEYKFGATVGKLALKIKVVNRQYEKLSWQAALLRSLFNIAFSIFLFVITYTIFKSNSFVNINTIPQYALLQKKFIDIRLYLLFNFLIVIIEIIFMLADKKRRSLHDRIAGTFVTKCC